MYTGTSISSMRLFLYINITYTIITHAMYISAILRNLCECGVRKPTNSYPIVPFLSPILLGRNNVAVPDSRPFRPATHPVVLFSSLSGRARSPRITLHYKDYQHDFVIRLYNHNNVSPYYIRACSKRPPRHQNRQQPTCI